MKSAQESADAKAGDTVSIRTAHEEMKGILLESYDKNILLLKLPSGYNQGISRKDIEEIHVLESKKELPHKEKEVEQDNKLPQIAMIITGGTISSKLDYETGAVKWLIKPEELFGLVPEIAKIARIEAIETPFMLASENMTAKEWQIIAKKAAELLNRPEINGIIITHGTDTLHYTAAALSFMLKNVNKPVVLTYAQRSSDRGSSDTKLNLICATHAALSEIAEVMLVGHGTINDDYCIAIRGTKARKMHASRRDTFRAINTFPIARIYASGKIEPLQEYALRNESRKVIADTKFEEKVALITYYPGAQPDILEFLMQQKYKGVIIEATGLGHVATEESRFSWMQAVKKAIKSGMIVCFAPQTLYGRLDPYVYSPGRKLLEAGVIFLEDMLPETAYVKLGWVLGHETDPEKVKKIMLTILAREINPQLDAGSFLS